MASVSSTSPRAETTFVPPIDPIVMKEVDKTSDLQTDGSFSLLALVVNTVAYPIKAVGDLFSSMKSIALDEENGEFVEIEDVQKVLLCALKEASTAKQFVEIIHHLSSLNTLYSVDRNEILDQVPTGCFLDKAGLDKASIFKQVHKDLERQANVEYSVDGERFLGNAEGLLSLLRERCSLDGRGFSEQDALAFMTFLQQGVMKDIAEVMWDCFKFPEKDIHVQADNPLPSEARIGYSYNISTSPPSILIRQNAKVVSIAEKSSLFYKSAPFAFLEGFLSINFANKTAISGWKINNEG